MGFRINTNIAALNAQRNLTNVSSKLDKSLERLSSGLRINKSADDASGMATSVYLRGQIGGLNQAARNANDAISMTQTAEGALDISTNILLRLRDLAVQAATDTTNRDLLIQEATQLVTELTRLANDTEFIGNTLLNGSFQSGKIQIGANQGQTISFSIGDVRAAALGERATATASLGSGTAVGGLSVGEFTVNGKLVAATSENDDQVSVLDLVGSVRVRDFSDTFVGASTGGSSLDAAHTVGMVKITNGQQVASLGFVINSSAIDVASQINSVITADSMAGVRASMTGSAITMVVTSGYDVGMMFSGTSGSAASFADITNLSGIMGSGGNFTVQINDGGGTAKISGLVINTATIATVSFAQGTDKVNVAYTTGGTIDLSTISNSDEAFIAALTAAINNKTTTNVTARTGSGNTIVLTADDGKNVTFNLTNLNITLASAWAGVGLGASATQLFASATTNTIYNGESSAIAKVAAIDSIKSSTAVDALVVATAQTGTAAVTAATVAAGDIYINGIDIGAVTVLAGDASGALLSAINSKSSTTGVSASLDSSNKLVLSADDGRNISVVAKSVAATSIGILSSVYRGGVKLNSSENFTIAGSTSDLGGIATKTYTTSLDYAVSLIDLSTQIGADDALATLDAAVYQINTTRSQLGAIQSRISLTIMSLTTTAENLSASESRIRDVDFAEETSVLTKNSILTQAATAILAQANQLPQLALQLLGG